MQLTRDTLEIVRRRINAAIAPVAKELGIAADLGRCVFERSGDFATFKLECKAIKADGSIMDRDAKSFVTFATSYDLKPTDLGRSFMFQNKQYVVSGLSTRSYKCPILAKDGQGRCFKFSSDTIKRLLMQFPAPANQVAVTAAADEGLPS